MATRHPRPIIAYLLCALALAASASASASALVSDLLLPPPPEPIRFCKQDAALSLDFCLAALPCRNATSASVDLYIAITRNNSSVDVGWLGIGIGPSMTGALMFVMYGGDVEEGGKTSVGYNYRTSVRRGMGHVEPVELSGGELVGGIGGLDIRVLESAGFSDEKSSDSDTRDQGEYRTATANIVIYSLPLWSSTTIDPTSPSQPWIWAYNPTQRITEDESLKMHSHDPNIGYGFFWTDFRAALSSTSTTTTNPPSLPFRLPFPPTTDPPSPSHLSTSTAPPIYRLGGPQLRNWMFHLHGLLASLATLLLYPLGALLLRTSDPRAFNFHWTTQALASVSLGLGAMLGWVLSRRVELSHQVVGLVVVGCVLGQVALGWRHHVGVGKGGRWMGKVHVWMGRGILAMGWVNVLLGLQARGYGLLTFVAVGLLIALEAAVLVRILGFRKPIPSHFISTTGKHGLRLPGGRARQPGARGPGGDALADEEYFELVGEEDQEEDGVPDENYDEDGRLQADVEWEENRRRGLREGGRKGEGKGEGEGEEARGVGTGGGGVDEPGKGERDAARKLKRLDIV